MYYFADFELHTTYCIDWSLLGLYAALLLPNGIKLFETDSLLNIGTHRFSFNYMSRSSKYQTLDIWIVTSVLKIGMFSPAPTLLLSYTTLLVITQKQQNQHDTIPGCCASNLCRSSEIKKGTDIENFMHLLLLLIHLIYLIFAIQTNFLRYASQFLRSRILRIS